MVTIPLGIGAYERSFSGSPEIELVNRYVEKSPTNLVEKIALIGRGGTTALATFSPGYIRGCFSKPGLFDGDLFVASGNTLYRYNDDDGAVAASGTIAGTGWPYVTWMKGIGYEFLFIADGSTLQYYSTRALGTLTLSGGDITTQVIKINSTYYQWSTTVNSGTPAGTVGAPWLVLVGSGGATSADDNETSLANMAAAINFSGTSGVTYSALLTGANADVVATSTPTKLVVTAKTDGTGGNSVTTTVPTGSYLAWGASTLAGGGTGALHTVTGMGSGETAKALTTLANHVLVSVSGTQKVYFIRPGEVIIDPLDFLSKESNPDNVRDMLTIGDRALVAGDGSSENWYATGDADAPFAPAAGSAFARGVIDGTPVVVNESVILVGNDGVVYQLGGDVQRISNYGIEERVRKQLRREAGL